MRRKHLLFSFLSVFLLFFLFTYSVGDAREDIYKAHAYLFGAFFSLSLLFLLAAKNSFIITYRLNNTEVVLFLFIQLSTFLFATLTSNFLNGLVVSGHQTLFFLFFFSLVKLNNFDKLGFLHFVSNSVIVICAISVIFALIGFTYGSFSFGPFIYEAPQRHIFRLRGWYASANYFGPVMATGALFAIFKILYNQRCGVSQKKILPLILILTMFLVGLFLSGSRGSWVAFLVSVLCFFLFQKNLVKLNLIRFLTGLIIFTFVSYGFYKTVLSLGYDIFILQDEIIRIETVEENIRGGERVNYWTTSLEMLRNASIKQLLIGHGPGYFFNVVGSAAHSGFLEIIIERGIVIFSLYLLLLWRVLKKEIYSNDQSNTGTIIISVLVFLIIKNATNNEFPSNNFSGIVFIMLLLASFFRSPEKPIKEND